MKRKIEGRKTGQRKRAEGGRKGRRKEGRRRGEGLPSEPAPTSLLVSSLASLGSALVDDSHRNIRIYPELFVSESSAVQMFSWWESVLLPVTEIP